MSVIHRLLRSRQRRLCYLEAVSGNRITDVMQSDMLMRPRRHYAKKPKPHLQVNVNKEKEKRLSSGWTGITGGTSSSSVK